MAEKIDERRKALSSLFGDAARPESQVTRKVSFDVESPEDVSEETAPASAQPSGSPAGTRRACRKSDVPLDGSKPVRMASIAYLEEDVYWKLRAISRRSGVSVSELTSQALRKAIARYEKENGEVVPESDRRSRRTANPF